MSFNLPQSNKKRVVIVGGGFGGLKLANKLSNSDFQVVLIDRNNYHQFPPLIYQVASAGVESFRDAQLAVQHEQCVVNVRRVGDKLRLHGLLLVLGLSQRHLCISFRIQDLAE